MVLINGPSVKDCGPVVKLAVKMWLAEKKRKKLPSVKRTKIPLLMDNGQTVQQEDSQPDIAVVEPAEPILEVSSFATHHNQWQTVQEEVAEIALSQDKPRTTETGLNYRQGEAVESTDLPSRAKIMVEFVDANTDQFCCEHFYVI